MSQRPSNRFFALMILAMISWGGSWVTAKWASSYPPQVTAFWRFFLSALSFVPILWIRRESFALPRKAWPWVGLSALFLALYNLLFLSAMQYGPGGYGGVLVPTLNPLFAFLISLAFLGHRFNARTAVGLALGVAGGLLQIVGPHFDVASFASPVNLLLVGAALTYALLTQFSSVAQRDLSVFRYSLWTSFLCSVILLPFAWSHQPFEWDLLGSDFWIDTVYLALIAGTFGTTLYFEAARRIGAARGSSFAFLVPASALGLAWIFLGEVPTWTSVVGGALSIGAVTMIQRSARG